MSGQEGVPNIAEAVESTEETHHKIIISLLIVITIVVLIILLRKCGKETWENCMLPNNPMDAAMSWKAAGVSDDQIKFLLDTYFPRYEGFTSCPRGLGYDSRSKTCKPPSELPTGGF